MAIPDNLKKTFETDYCGKRLIVETGYIAEQANGAVLLRLGDTAILVTHADREHVIDMLKAAFV